jgi:hypothetical protein
MIKPHAVEFVDVLVFERVKNLPSFFARADEAHLAQSAQLMGYGGLGHIESFGQGADTHLAFDEQGDNPHAAGVAEGAEKFSKLDSFEFGEFHFYMNN